jgi:hypothetical protein
MRNPINQFFGLFANTMKGLCTLNRIQFAAPWRDVPRRSC